MKKKDLSKFTIEQLDKMFAALPLNSPYRDVIAQEIESRVDDEDSSDETDNSDQLEKALDYFNKL